MKFDRVELQKSGKEKFAAVTGKREKFGSWKKKLKKKQKRGKAMKINDWYEM